MGFRLLVTIREVEKNSVSGSREIPVFLVYRAVTITNRHGALLFFGNPFTVRIGDFFRMVLILHFSGDVNYADLADHPPKRSKC